MDILKTRHDLSVRLRDLYDKLINEDEVEQDNPMLTSPPVFKTVRELLVRYAHGEVCFSPENVVEPVQYNDDIIEHQPNESRLDVEQRVADFRTYLEKAQMSFDIEDGTETAQKQPESAPADTTPAESA